MLEYEFIAAAATESPESFGRRLGTVDINSSITAGTALHQAYGGRNFSVARLLLENGADPFAVNYFGLSVLQAAVIANDASAVKTLLERRAIKGVDPRINDPDAFGRTPLHTAATMGNHEMCKTLLDYGASPLRVDASFYPPIYHAAANGHWPTYAYLLARCPEASTIAPPGAKSAADLAPGASTAKRAAPDSYGGRRTPPGLRAGSR
jgi:ankyrin repeat protein